jgi:hypothetical protein
MVQKRPVSSASVSSPPLSGYVGRHTDDEEITNCAEEDGGASKVLRDDVRSVRGQSLTGTPAIKCLPKHKTFSTRYRRHHLEIERKHNILKQPNTLTSFF